MEGSFLDILKSKLNALIIFPNIINTFTAYYYFTFSVTKTNCKCILYVSFETVSLIFAYSLPAVWISK